MITELIPMEDFVLMTLKAKMTVNQKAKAFQPIGCHYQPIHKPNPPKP